MNWWAKIERSAFDFTIENFFADQIKNKWTLREPKMIAAHSPTFRTEGDLLF